jgi:predicted dienelactone hydrolase
MDTTSQDLTPPRRRRKILVIAALLVVAAVLALFLSARPPIIPGVSQAEASAPDPGQAPLSLRIWSPAHTVANKKLPLIIISHGTGGSKDGHNDTAAALTKAGFIVASLTHTGDNYRDTSGVSDGTQLTSRPRHIKRVIDYMLSVWPDRARIDAEQIGMFGFSAGGFTALVVAGATPDLSRGPDYCRKRPDAWTCRYIAKHGLDPSKLPPVKPEEWQHDPRVKAIIIAAPAIGYSFDQAGLAPVRIPVQIWHANKDEIVEDSPFLIKAALPLPPEFRPVAKASHFSFIEPCTVPVRAIITVMHWFGTEPICDNPTGFDRRAFHAQFNTEVVRFFKAKLAAQ